jgi:hypothetical protein
MTFELMKTALATALPTGKITDQDLPGEIRRLEAMQTDAAALPADETTGTDLPALKALIAMRLNLCKGAMTRLNLRAKRNGEDKRKR